MGGKPPDPYEVLGLVQADAPSASDVRKAYHRLARVHHPDKARTPEEKDAAETRFKEIGAAYEILSDPEKRDKYDRDGFDDHEWMTPAEAEEEERHARRMYCAAMGIPETVVREVWCDLEELYAGCVRREGVVVHVVAVESGVPEKESKVFSVRVRPGTRDGREVRFDASAPTPSSPWRSSCANGRTRSSRARRTHPRTSSSGVRSPPRNTRRAPSSASPR